MVLPSTALTALFLQCAPQVAPDTLAAIIKTESNGNPYVINNITDHTSKSFSTPEQAILYANTLSERGGKYSAGLMQIYSSNFNYLKINAETVFDPCTNIRAGAKIITENYLSQSGNDQQKLRKALSVYYSGNSQTGFKKETATNTSYVERVEKNAYIVPALMPDSTLTSQQNQQNMHSDQWDVFGDFTNETNTP